VSWGSLQPYCRLGDVRSGSGWASSRSIATELRTPAEKLREIEKLRSVYGMTDFLMLGQILAHLQSRDATAAMAVARATHFNPSWPMPNASTKIIDMMRGQGEALCQLAELLVHDLSCWNALTVFRGGSAAWCSSPSRPSGPSIVP